MWRTRLCPEIALMMMLLCWLRTKINIKNDDNEQHIERSESWMGKNKRNETLEKKFRGGESKESSETSSVVVPESRPVDVLMKLCAVCTLQHPACEEEKTKTLCSFLHDKHTGERSHIDRD